MSRAHHSLLLAVALGWIAPLVHAQPPPAVVVQADERMLDLAQLESAITRGVDFLLAVQNPDGSWGSARRTKDLNIFAPVPGAHDAFRVGTTSLALAGILDAGDTRPAVAEAIERAERWLELSLPMLRRATPVALYNVWGHAYSITALARLVELRAGDPARQERLRRLIALQVEALATYESVDGGWGYYDFRYHTRKPSAQSTSFVNATGLIALDEARRVGVEAPPALVERAIVALQRQRNPDFTYVYSESWRKRPRGAINRPGGSLARSQSGNLALRLWGDTAVTEAVLDSWLERLWARNGWLDIGRKRPRPHESWFAVSGYFYYYGHYYAARCIELLPTPRRAHHAAALAGILLDQQEPDGSWWDYPLYDYGHPYGTGYVLSALTRCRPAD